MFKYFWDRIKNFFVAQSRLSRVTIVVVLLVVVIGVFGIAMPAFADDLGQKVGRFFANILLFVASFMGHLLVMIIGLLLDIVSYNNFVDAPAVNYGWTVVRDICNLFFVLILLVIGFGSVLRLESYKYNQLLGKLIMMIILVNFSKMIAGFFIDISQVVLMTFTNAFAATAAENFTTALGLEKMLNFSPDEADKITTGLSGAEMFGLAILPVIMLVVAIFTMLAMVLIFLIRIIMLWVLVVLSPLAYFFSVLPSTQQYGKKWWENFTKWLVTGPVLAFFIWFGLTMIAGGAIEPTSLGGENIPTNSIKPSGGIGAASSSDSLLQFIMAIGMFVVALITAQSLGGMAGSFSGKMLGKLQGMGTAPLNFAKGRLKAGGKWAAKRADDAQAAGISRLSRTKLAGWGVDKLTGKKGLLSGKRESLRFAGLAAAKERIEEQGVQLRTIPEAWKKRSAQKEEERTRDSSAIAQDVMNRSLSLGSDKTDYYSLARASRNSKIKSEISAAGTEKELLLHRYNDEFTDDDGKVIKGKEAHAEATLELLLGNHDINEILKDKNIAGVMQGMGKTAGKHTKKDFLDYIEYSHGDTKSTTNLIKRLEEQGLQKNDSYLKGSTEWDNVEKKNVRVTDTERSAELSSGYISKVTGRNFAGSMRRQNLFEERTDENGNLSFRTLHDDGKALLMNNLDQLNSQKLEHYQDEFIATVGQNIDVLLEFAEEAYESLGTDNEIMSEKDLGKLEKFIGHMASGSDDPEKYDPEKMEDSDGNKLDPEESRKAWEDMVKSKLENTQNQEFKDKLTEQGLSRGSGRGEEGAEDYIPGTNYDQIDNDNVKEEDKDNWTVNEQGVEMIREKDGTWRERSAKPTYFDKTRKTRGTGGGPTGGGPTGGGPTGGGPTGGGPTGGGPTGTQATADNYRNEAIDKRKEATELHKDVIANPKKYNKDSTEQQLDKVKKLNQDADNLDSKADEVEDKIISAKQEKAEAIKKEANSIREGAEKKRSEAAKLRQSILADPKISEEDTNDITDRATKLDNEADAMGNKADGIENGAIVLEKEVRVDQLGNQTNRMGTQMVNSDVAINESSLKEFSQIIQKTLSDMDITTDPLDTKKFENKIEDIGKHFEQSLSDATPEQQTEFVGQYKKANNELNIGTISEKQLQRNIIIALNNLSKILSK